MTNRIQPAVPLGQELKRLFQQRIADAVSCISQRQGPATRVNDARKHVKKARAILQLARHTIGDAYDDADEALRVVNRALGPLADAYRIGQTLDAVNALPEVRLPPASLSAVRLRLAAHASAIVERATADAIRARAIRLLDSTRRQSPDWDLTQFDRTAVIRELKDMHAKSRRSRRVACRRPSTDTHHAWRRRIKREAYALRVIAAMVGDRLKDERHELARLDKCLGDLHDVMVLIETIAADSPLSRAATAEALRQLRAVAIHLRHRAYALATVLDERPRELAKRIGALWGLAPRPVPREPVQPWLRRA